MNQRRASVSAVVLLLCLAWAVLVWVAAPPVLAAVIAPSLLWHRVASVILAAGLSIYLFLAVTFERTD